MRKTILLSIVALVLMMSLVMVNVQAITWGELAGDNYSNVGNIVYHSVMDEAYLCGASGVLISPTVFLTAGHNTAILQYAFYMGLIDEVHISFHPYNPRNEDSFHSVSEIYTHPLFTSNYERACNTYDIGIIILAIPVTGILFATLPEAGVLDELQSNGDLFGSKFTVVGYGDILEWPPPNIIEDPQRRYAESNYLALLENHLLLSQNHAIDDECGGTCYGDSGGPVFWEDDGEQTLVALCSWGDENCIATGFSYRLDTLEALEFISSFLV